MPRLSYRPLAFALAAALLAGCSSRPGKPRHVLLIVVDTLRADHLTPYGYPLETTPRLAELAQECVVFERAFAQASFTTPSMVSLHTGSYVAQEAFKIPAEKTTLAEIFQKGGYATGAFIHNNMLNAENHFGRGFDRFEYQDPPYGPNAPILDWIESNKARKCFTYVHLNEAHDPYEAPDITRFSDERSGLDDERLAYFSRVSEERGLVDNDDSIAAIDAEIGGYDDDVHYSDRRIGQILDAVREMGLWDETAVVIASDHGEGLWTRAVLERLPKYAGQAPTLFNTLQMTHGSHAHWELIHVPLMLRAPGLPEGARVSAIVENVDVASTLLELCDLPSPGSLQGESLVGLALGKAPARERSGAFSFTRFNTSLVTEDGMQLIEPTDLGRCSFNMETQLYDLKVDPRARHNVAAQHPALVEELQGLARERLERGICETDLSFGPETQMALNQLGYLESGVVEQVRDDLVERSDAELLAILEAPYQSCLYRWEAARAFEGRELTAEVRARLEALVERETAQAVRDAVQKLL